MARLTVTDAEVLDALVQAGWAAAPEDARTVREFMAESGANIQRVREALRVLSAQGRVTVHRVRRERIDGLPTTVSAYTIRPAA